MFYWFYLCRSEACDNNCRYEIGQLKVKCLNVLRLIAASLTNPAEVIALLYHFLLSIISLELFCNLKNSK